MLTYNACQQHPDCRVRILSHVQVIEPEILNEL